MKRTHPTASLAVRLAGALAVLLWGLTGCPKKPNAEPDGGANAVEAANGVGLRVRLPPGWTANPAGPEALIAGPKGRGVLRIQRTNEKDLPTPQTLQKGFQQNAKGLAIEPLASEREATKVEWRARLKSADPAKGTATWTVLLGAKKAKEGIYLCSTEPGATDAEVEAAAKICASLGD